MSVDASDDGRIDLDTPAPAPTPARRRLVTNRRLVLTGLVALVLVASGLAGAGYYVAQIPTPVLLPLPSSTTLYYNDGTVLARLGQIDITPLTQDEIAPMVKQVALAAEGPATITRSVVRVGTDMRGSTLSAKARLAVAAWKLEQARSDDEILTYFLNATPFGRNAFGIEGAARTYFDKSARADAPEAERLTTAEAMLLLAVVRQPYPDPDDPQGRPGYDPTFSPAARANSEQRWNEIRDALAGDGVDTAGLTYPGTATRPWTPTGRGSALTGPAGLTINHVLDELSHTKGSPLYGKSWASIESGGYSIHTTLDPRVQQSLERAASPAMDGSVMHAQPERLQAAAVVVEPGTGQVLGYYGGADGLGNDYAGFYYDEANEATGVGRHPPGSSFMVYTLATALRSGISLQSRWQWTPHKQVGRDPLNPIRNASTCPSDRNPQTGVCTLLESTTASLFVPMYDVTVSVSPSAVLETARDAGIDYLWTDARERVDLRAPTVPSTLTPSKFDLTVGLGQYPVTVLDQANAMATFAAGGLRAQAHFVASVKQGDEVILAEPAPRPDASRVLTAEQVADLTYALSNGTDTAIKTGTWEFNQNPVENAHAWSLGYTSGLAMAVWIGSKADEQPLRDASGGIIYGAGLPTTLLRRVLGEAQTALGKPPTPFPPPVFGGRVDPPGSVTD